MNNSAFDSNEKEMSWCPGCGNFSILTALKKALAELELSPDQVVTVSGIGQAAKLPHYLATHYYNGLHGRALPTATAIKAANPRLTVLVSSGDGDIYAEGGNHFLHAIRRNPDITTIVHNNMVYGLTRGQASPTSQQGFQTLIQTQGVTSEPFNPLTVAISLNASFVARAFAGDIPQTCDLLKRAIRHRGFALVDILQPCVTFNRVNTFRWFRDNSYDLEESHDRGNREEAFRRATEVDRLPLGIFFEHEGRPTFEENCRLFQDDARPLFRRSVDREKLRALIDSYRA